MLCLRAHLQVCQMISCNNSIACHKSLLRAVVIHPIIPFYWNNAPHKIHTKLHPGHKVVYLTYPHYIVRISIDDVISSSFFLLCKQSVKNGGQYICRYNKKKRKIHGGLKI